LALRKLNDPHRVAAIDEYDAIEASPVRVSSLASTRFQSSLAASLSDTPCFRAIDRVFRRIEREPHAI
jgi:hypothetical protein